MTRFYVQQKTRMVSPRFACPQPTPRCTAAAVNGPDLSPAQRWLSQAISIIYSLIKVISGDNPGLSQSAPGPRDWFTNASTNKCKAQNFAGDSETQTLKLDGVMGKYKAIIAALTWPFWEPEDEVITPKRQNQEQSQRTRASALVKPCLISTLPPDHSSSII